MSAQKTDWMQKELGAHVGCGGQVLFSATPSMSWRHCTKCKESSMFGKSVETAPVR